MALMYPVVLVVAIIISVLLFFIRLKKNNKYTDGKKVANTKFIKESTYYKSRMKVYKVLSQILKIVSVFVIVLTSVLITRITTTRYIPDEAVSRDVYLCLDISGSMDEINLELISTFKKIVKDLEGDRIGIVIFNCNPIVLCPLTDDQEYLLSKLDHIERVLKNYSKTYANLSSDDIFDASAIISGTQVESDRGGSIIGDGLAYTVYRFPKMEEYPDRTRIILLCTDNELTGEPYISLEDAASLCKKYNILLYAMCPEIMKNTEYGNTYKEAVEKNAGGKFYIGNDKKMISSLVGEIKQTKQTQIKKTNKIRIIDYPEAIFIILIIFIFILFILEKKVVL